MMRHPPRPRHAGFTLLEMLVAIAIFATLSLGAYQVLQGVLTSDEVAKRKEARLYELQLAFTLLERDVTQMVPRSGRIEGENNKVLLAASRFGQQSDDWGMAFMRGGWLNPDGMLPRSQLQRVGWRLKDQTLERLSYLYPDPVIGSEPRIQPVLKGVTALRLYFYDQGRWREEWTQRSVLPYGLAVELDLEDYGTIRRQFLIGAGGQRYEENSQSQDNPNSNNGNNTGNGGTDQGGTTDNNGGSVNDNQSGVTPNEG
nr:type II secretion system minor pseudopilin GspJ [Aeromonas enteropelogenes]